MKEKCKYLGKFAPFIIMAIFYIISIFILRIIDLTFIGDANDFSGLIYGNIISALFLSLCVLIIYIVTSFFSNKISNIVTAILFCLLFLAEAGLMIYHDSTGMLMGNEIILRPLWETLLTIKSNLNFWIISGTILLIFVYICLSLFLSKRNINNSIICITLLLIIVLSPLFFVIKPNQDKYVVNKMWYCVNSCLSKKSDSVINKMTIEFDSEKIRKHEATYPERKILDKHYPLERQDNIDNVLGYYFEKKDVKPDVVFVIVESLGSDFFGYNELGYSFTPFLDSLSEHSLLWTNCLSTTPRSAGVLPATTASVPYGFKGFQFGDIPEHNSLISILKDNSYNTNIFYASYFSFDRVYDYLIAQEIDYMSPFSYECSKNKKNNDFDYSSWGYHDAKLYERGMSIINERNDDNPDLDIFVTISQHDNGLKLNTNKELQDYYYSKAEEILTSIPVEKRDNLSGKKGFMAAFLYGDDALKNFFKQYNENRKDENVIFVITGDHSLNLNSDNPLNAYHVPLIIWSPLLKKTQHFNSVVSHNDITPSLTALLKNNFHLKTPENVHWVSDGLNTDTNFVCNLKTYFISSFGKTANCLYDNIFYIEQNGNDCLYKVENGLILKEIKDDKLLEVMKERMNIMMYVDNYVYVNNKLTKTPIIQSKIYETLESVNIDSVVCKSGCEKPSVLERPLVDIYSTKFRSEYSEIKVVMTAKIKYTADISNKQFIRLSLKSSNAIWSPEEIYTNIIEKDYKPNQWCNLSVVKVFKPINKHKNSKIEIYLRPTEHDHQWNPEHSVTLKDINITFLGTKQ